MEGRGLESRLEGRGNTGNGLWIGLSNLQRSRLEICCNGAAVSNLHPRWITLMGVLSN